MADEPKAEETQVAPVTAAVIREDLVAELELLGGRAKSKLAAYARQSLAVFSSVLDGLDDKPPAKDTPAKKDA